ncbi:unnamed protein product [Didymodactylos carnosus]|uniref:Chromo domain-containing protein n=1 Tax=Didymodactylos carnosus TaxID=1234261 RepID=A0A814Z181_9BILA|nr:unnamed protein product [Didymodactylos carnosus]CAF1329711.1 unnamed protein product [Didymodactylos carnosus]CAF3998781.1 unnamed protein product [Didymodactylos carnosus]CAF4141178.1 unnamed protein product [Didymodactylos carnosus]
MGKNQAQTSDDDDLDENNFVVEKILDMKVKKGQNHYFLKWKNFDESENTWEPESNLDCPELISAFLATRKSTPARTSSSLKATSTASSSKRKLTQTQNEDEDSSQTTVSSTELNHDQTNSQSAKRPRIELEHTGYSRQQTVEKIMGATDIYKELMFLIKWQGIEKPELVPARIVNIQSPQMVIKFYEDRLTWADPHAEKN